MGVSINGQPMASAIIITKKRSGHTKAKAPTISLDQPGRLRVANLMALFNKSHSALYADLAMGRVPKPDGRDRRPYWNTETIRKLLDQ